MVSNCFLAGCHVGLLCASERNDCDWAWALSSRPAPCTWAKGSPVVQSQRGKAECHRKGDEHYPEGPEESTGPDAWQYLDVTLDKEPKTVFCPHLVLWARVSWSPDLVLNLLLKFWDYTCALPCPGRDCLGSRLWGLLQKMEKLPPNTWSHSCQWLMLFRRISKMGTKC